MPLAPLSSRFALTSLARIPAGLPAREAGSHFHLAAARRALDRILPSCTHLLLALAVVVGTGSLAAQTTQDPVILLVPGYTPLLSQKDDYFLDQRSFFTGLGRDVLYLNTPNGLLLTYRDFQYPQFDLGPGHDPNFDSNRTRIDLNAIEIVAVLSRLRSMGRKVTIVSHSKGGQDVFHALVDLDPGLWPIVTGWLAFTSNFFESQFKVSLPTIPSLPGIAAEWGRTPEPYCPFRYPQYHVDSPGMGGGSLACIGSLRNFDTFIDRQLYMASRSAAIDNLTANVRILCAYGAFLPQQAQPTPEMDTFNMRIQTQSQVIEGCTGIRFCGANDGVVPMRAAQLPGARFSVPLPSDPSAGRLGADHDSPSGSRPGSDWGIWTPPFRKEMTRHYIRMLESFRPFGSGCGGASGIPKLDALGDSVPFVTAGSSFSLELRSLPAGAPTTMALGFSNQQWGNIPLPFDLTPLGAPQCFALVSFDAFYSLVNTNGVALWTIAIPLDPQLVGLRFYNQGLVLDASANGLGIAFSNGGAATLTAR